MEGSAELKVVDVDDDKADEVFGSLSSDTARKIFCRLYDDPATASDLADAADTTLQNTRYHLERLESAGLIEPVDTWYSERGNEMTVYAPTGDPLVVTAGSEGSMSLLRNILNRLIGSITLLALASVVIDRLVRQYGGTLVENGSSSGVTTTQSPTGSSPPPRTPSPTQDPQTPTSVTTSIDAMKPNETVHTPPNTTATETPTIAETPLPTPTSKQGSGIPPETITQTISSLSPTPISGETGVVFSLPPGAIFFAGGLVAILIAFFWWYRGQSRSNYPV